MRRWNRKRKVVRNLLLCVLLGTAAYVLLGFSPYTTGQKLDRLERDWGVTVLQDGEDAVFRLAPSVRFEDLDYVWGALFEVLG